MFNLNIRGRMKQLKIRQITSRLLLVAITGVLWGCSPDGGKTSVQIGLQVNGSLKITGPNPAILGEISRDSTPGIWQQLLPVYKMPADTELKDYQLPQPGTYRLSGDAVLFTPDTPFIKWKSYYLRYYRFGEGKSVFDIIKNKRRLGTQAYTDLVFGEVFSR